MEDLKQTRSTQWGSTNNTPRGWARYRSTTFLEIVGAKVDRALQAIHLINQTKNQNYSDYEVNKLEDDAYDSIVDAHNYLEELIKRCQDSKAFLTKMEMP